MKFLTKLDLGNFPLPNTTYPSQHTELKRSETTFTDLLRKLAHLSDHLFKNLFTQKTPTASRVPIVKSTTQIGGVDNYIHNNYLTGKCVLCVGGRTKLYPQYREFVEALNGNLVTFHGDTNDCLDNLHQLLENADLVICPIDCINHDAFFIVKYYCKYSSKPCVLLDHSWPTTFQKGLKVLAYMIR